MSLYILSIVLMVLGLVLTSHQQRDEYRDTWALVFLACGFIALVVAVIVQLWPRIAAVLETLWKL